MNRRSLTRLFSTLLLAASALVVGSACGGSSLFDEISRTDFSPGGSVFGTVSDAESGARLAGALVSTQGKFVVTNANGDYALVELESKESEITAALDGYESLTRRSNTDIVRVDFQLQRVQ